MADKPEYVPGLAGVPAARSSVCLINGAEGKLQYRGYPIEQLAEKCTYEQVAYMLLFGEFATDDELKAFEAELARERSLKFRIIDVLKNLPERGHPMDALTAAVASMGMFYPGDHVEDLEFRRLSAVRLVAKLPTVVAAWHRLRVLDESIVSSDSLGPYLQAQAALFGHLPRPPNPESGDLLWVLAVPLVAATSMASREWSASSASRFCR